MVITLNTLQGTGIVRIQSLPSGATLMFDGDDYGKVPVTITNVEVGEYDYVLKMEGYDEYKGKAIVKAGELCCSDVIMEAGSETVKCVHAPPIPGVPPIPIIPGYPGYMIIPERTVIYILGGILVGILIWALLSRNKTDDKKTG